MPGGVRRLRANGSHATHRLRLLLWVQYARQDHDAHGNRIALVTGDRAFYAPYWPGGRLLISKPSHTQHVSEYAAPATIHVAAGAAVWGHDIQSVLQKKSEAIVVEEQHRPRLVR